MPASGLNYVHSLPLEGGALRYPDAVTLGYGQSQPTLFCGCLGDLYVLQNDPVGEDCWVWRTDARTLRQPEQPVSCQGSLLELACEVAELYHDRHALYLPELRGEALEVIWLELAADETLLVFLKPSRLRS